MTAERAITNSRRSRNCYKGIDQSQIILIFEGHLRFNLRPALRSRLRLMTDRILLVCDANVCRSPYAESVLHSLLSAAGVQRVAVASAGLDVAPGHPICVEAAERLAQRETIEVSRAAPPAFTQHRIGEPRAGGGAPTPCSDRPDVADVERPHVHDARGGGARRRLTPEWRAGRLGRVGRGVRRTPSRGAWASWGRSSWTSSTATMERRASTAGRSTRSARRHPLSRDHCSRDEPPSVGLRGRP